MKAIVVKARVLKFFIVLLSLVAVVACYTPPHHHKNPHHNNKGFGREDSDDKKKKKIGAAAVAATSVKSGRRYLEPFALELAGDNDDGDNDGDGERGVRTLTDRPAGDILLEIPLEDTITVGRIRARLASCEKEDNSVNKNDNDEQSDTSDDDDIDDEEEALALGLLRLRYEALDPYVVDVLPKKHFNVWTLPVDLWKETSAILPRCYSETFDATRDRVNDFAKRIATNYNEEAYTMDDALWAFSMVRSRSLAVPELDDDNNNDNDNDNGRMPLALIPGLDLFNHAFGSGTQLQLVVDDDNDG